MIEIAAITSVVTSLKAATDVVRALKNVDVSLEKAELKLKIADLLELLANAKLEINSIQEEIENRNNIIEELKKSLELKANVIKQNQAYYEIKDNKPFGAPFCMYCWEQKHKLVHLHNDATFIRNRICPECENVYELRCTFDNK